MDSHTPTATTSTNVPPSTPEKRQAWKLTLRVVALLIFIVGIVWMVIEPGFEPLLAFLGALVALLTTLYNPEQAYIGDKPRFFWQHRDKRAEMLERLQTSWIEGVLYTALREVQHFKIETPLTPDAVVRHKDVGEYPLRNTSDILRVCRDFDGRLLILGAPGAGKTILLLQLAEMLLQEARAKPQALIPVVFNLPSWAREQKSLRDWLLDEFNTSYRVQRKIAQKWIDNNELVLLLDGLDEVRDEVRAQCVAAINEFQIAHPAVRMVVCSRIKDYDDLRVKLNLAGAITLQALDSTEVDQYLASQGKRLSGLVAARAQDTTLYEMSTVPFLLNTMVYTYAEASAAEIGNYPEPAERRQKLFERYVEQRLREHRSQYSLNEVLRYLKWLATKIQAYSLTILHSADNNIAPFDVQKIFYPSDIEPSWLDKNNQQQFRFIVIAFATMLVAIGFLVISMSFIIITGSILHPVSLIINLILGFLLVFSFYRFKKIINNMPQQLEFNDSGRWAVKILRFSLRLLLWYAGVMPLRLEHFLNRMVKYHILRHFGNGYSFIHRYLLESLAGQDEITLLIYQLADTDTRDRAAEILVRVGEPAIKQLAEVFTDLRYGKFLSQETLLAIMLNNPADLKNVYDTNRQYICISAIKILNRIGSLQAQKFLVVASCHFDKNVRDSATDALVNLGYNQFVQLLIKLLLDYQRISPFTNVRICDLAVIILEKINTPEALEAVKAWREREKKV